MALFYTVIHMTLLQNWLKTIRFVIYTILVVSYNIQPLQTFPDQIWLPPSGAQRGTLLRTVGDPSSPLLPSKHYAHRITEEELLNSGVLPAIPVTSIGYRDAIKIFDNLDGPEIHVFFLVLLNIPTL